MSRSDSAENRSAGSEIGEPVPEANNARRWRLLLRILMVLFAVWCGIVVVLANIATWHEPRHRALIMMLDGLVLFWIVIGGFLMHRYREQAAT